MVSTPNFIDGTWNIVSTLNIEGDPNGDILWQNIADQSLVLWQQDGNITTAASSLPSVDDFDARLVGDFDGDGQGDPLLRNGDTGINKMLLSDSGLVDTIAVGAIWDPSATTDVNNDGMDDIFWFNTSNASLSVWQMDGASLIGVTNLASGYATDDNLLSAFNGTAGDTFDSVWLDVSANNLNITSYDAGVRTVTDTFTVGAGNVFVNSGDYNGDGDKDFLFRDGDGNDTGSIEIVFSNGFNEIARLTYDVPLFQGLAFEAGGDFDGDGISEVLMRDTVGGGTSVYNVVGGSVSSQTLVGSDGNDLIDGTDGNDRVFGGDGDDIIFDSGSSITNSDTLFGGDGDDLIDGGVEDDKLFGGNGDDYLHGQSGDDFLSGGLGNDTLHAGNGTDMLFGDDGDDYLVGGSFGFDHLKGGAGNDVIQGVGDRTLQEGDAGNDQLFGSSSLDYLFGGAGDDYLVGGLSLDTLNGGSGNDILIGTDLAGSSGTDDTLTGGSGNDYFYLGNDDTNYYTGTGRAFITDFSSFSDYVVLNGSSSNYSFVDTGVNIEIRQSSDANVIAVVENVATAADVSSKAIYIG